MSVSSATRPPRDQYQHYIPRFILRSFQDAQIRQRSKKQRQKDYNKARKTGIDHDVITVFDSGTQVLEQRPLAKEYGVVNMYRDDRNSANVDHLEEGLSKLETLAAKTIKNIHVAVAAGRKFEMKRKELEVIRKFVYIMHYRRVSLLPSYFDDDDPDNSTMKEFYQSFRARHNLTRHDDIWLWGLKYYLETPHQTILATAEEMKQKYGGETQFFKMMLTKVDPDLDNWHAVDYALMAETAHLVIWEAAEGEEFVVGSNSFGLFEGALDAHRLFIVSPRIALVLRSNYFTLDQTSVLAKIDTPRPQNHYINFRPPSTNLNSELVAAMHAYRKTPESRDDLYIFTPSKLTPTQTYNVNFFILSHLNMGSVAFASYIAMSRSLKHQLQSDVLYIAESKYYLRSLLGMLASKLASESSDGSSSPLSGLDLIIRSVASGAIEFSSDYDRAYRVYHAATDDPEKYCQTSADIHAMTARAIIKIKPMLPPLPHIQRHMHFPSLSRALVKTLPKAESELFFALVGYQFDVLEVASRGSDVVEQIMYDAAVIGFAHWLAENRASVLQALMPHPLRIMV